MSDKGGRFFERVPCVIGVDQSYTRTGVSIAINNKVKKVLSIDFKGLKGKSEKRNEVRKILKKCIEVCLKKYSQKEVVVLVEMIRTYTASSDLRPDVIKAQAALVATIVDVAYDYEIKVFSIDTRVWKKAVLGTSKPIFEPIKGVKNPQKFGSVRKAIELGFEKELSIRKGNNSFTSYNDDMADAICISLSGFCANKNYFHIEE